MSRLSYATRVLMNYGSDKNCPFCHSAGTRLLQRKQIILHLRKCGSCGLMYRWPKEAPAFSEKFYQDDYQEVSFTTDLPDKATLKGFIDSNFIGSPKDFSDSIRVLKSFLPEGRVLDFGCSWGYGIYQLRQAGYDAFGFEISRPRAELGRREFGVEILDQLSDLEKIPSQSIDGIYASHVLEHLLSLRESFDFFARVLKPGGVVFIMVPNAGGRLARELGVRWPPMINEKHTLALDGEFFQKNMSPFGFQVTAFSETQDTGTIRAAAEGGGPLSVEGQELRIIGRRITV